MRHHVEDKPATSSANLPINKDRPGRVIKPANPVFKSQVVDPLPSSQKRIVANEGYLSQGKMAVNLANGGQVSGGRVPSRPRLKSVDPTADVVEEPDNLFGNILGFKEFSNKDLEISETFENGLFPLQRNSPRDKQMLADEFRPRRSLTGMARGPKPGDSPTHSRESSPTRAEDGRLGENQRKKTPNLRTKTPPHKLELTIKQVPEHRSETPKLIPVSPPTFLSPEKTGRDNGVARTKVDMKAKTEKKENLTLHAVNESQPKPLEKSTASGVQKPGSSQSLDKSSPLEFALDVPPDKLSERQLKALVEQSAKSQTGTTLPTKARDAGRLGTAKPVSPIPNKTPLLPTTKPKPKEPFPQSPPKPVSSVSIPNKVEAVSKANFRSTARPASQSPGPSHPQIDIVEWITNNVIMIPPVFKATVETSRQPGYFMVASNTHNGTTRAYNEDRVKITTFPDPTKKRKINAPLGPETLGLFSIFDGHGSSNCSQFLFDRLHTILLERCNNDFTKLTSIATGLYQDVDNEFRRHSAKINDLFAGSCACTLIQCNKTLWALNLGDSRCILSKNKGTEVKQLTQDHKPSERSELERIVGTGGSIFRAVWDVKKRIDYEQKVATFDELEAFRKVDKKIKDKEYGPWRLNPGGLSVSRCFGDFECKSEPGSGAMDVVSNEPEVTTEPVESVDFALIGCKLISRRDFRRVGQQRDRTDGLEDNRVPPKRRHQVEAGRAGGGVL